MKSLQGKDSRRLIRQSIDGVYIGIDEAVVNKQPLKYRSELYNPSSLRGALRARRATLNTSDYIMCACAHLLVG